MSIRKIMTRVMQGILVIFLFLSAFVIEEYMTSALRYGISVPNLIALLAHIIMTGSFLMLILNIPEMPAVTTMARYKTSILMQSASYVLMVLSSIALMIDNAALSVTNVTLCLIYLVNCILAITLFSTYVREKLHDHLLLCGSLIATVALELIISIATIGNVSLLNTFLIHVFAIGTLFYWITVFINITRLDQQA